MVSVVGELGEQTAGAEGVRYEEIYASEFAT